MPWAWESGKLRLIPHCTRETFVKKTRAVTVVCCYLPPSRASLNERRRA